MPAAPPDASTPAGGLRWIFEETPASRRVCLWTGIVGALAILAAIFCIRSSLVYDEVFHLTTVKALFRLGFSREFLMGTPWSAPGPLFAFVQGAWAWLTGLRPPGIRLVNYGCALALIALLTQTLRLRAPSAPLNVALGIVAAPMGWPIFALALTEAPAMVFAAGGTLLTLLWQRADLTPARRDALAIAAGLSLGVAVAGRQVFFAALPAIALLARPGALRPALLQLAAAILIPAGLFAVWGGMTPPGMAFAGHGLRPSSAVLSYAYGGLTTLVLAPRFFSLSRRWLRGLAAGLLVVNLAFGVYVHLPFAHFLADRFPIAAQWLLMRVWGSGQLVLGGLFVASALKNLWERRANRSFAFVCAATLLMGLTPIKITHVWDARYASVMLPFLVIALGNWVTNNYFRAARMVAGMIVAAGLLHQVQIAHWDEEHPPTMREIFFSLQPGE